MKHCPTPRRIFALSSIALTALALLSFSTASAADQTLLKPDGKPADQTKRVKVFILMGQSNMVGMGDIQGGNAAWGPTLLKPVLSVYEGAYSPGTDYDKMTAVATKELATKDDWKAPESPKEFTAVVRGQIQMKAAGVYEFSPGYGGSTRNIMVIDGTEVYRSEDGKEAVRKAFTFEQGKAYPFKVTYRTRDINDAGWYSRTDIPGTLGTLVKQQKKYPFLLDDESQWSVRKDVYYYDARTKKGSPLSAPSNNGGSSIGP